MSQRTIKYKKSLNKHFFQDSHIVFLGLLLNLFLISTASAQSPQHSKLVFLGNKNLAPVVYLDHGVPSGIVVDIVRALAKHIPQPIEIIAMDWSEAQKLVARGEADALIQINPTEERKKIYDFSDTLLVSQFSIFTTSHQVGISGTSSLHGLRVGVEAGGLPKMVLEKKPLIQLVIIPNFIDGFKSLRENTLDAVVVDYLVGSYILAESKIRNIKVTGVPIAISSSAIAVKKGNLALLDNINSALRIIKTDGTYRGILDKWKPTEGVFYSREQITHFVYLAVILFFLIVVLVAVIWLVSLKTELTNRKVVEGKLRVQYSTLRSIIDSTNALIFSVDRQYRYTSFNRGHAIAMQILYGAEIKQGRSILEYMTVPEDREIARRNIDRALTGEHLVEDAYSGGEPRSRRYFHVSHSPIKTTRDAIIGAAVLAQDITERKRAEDSLGRLNRELQAISNCNKVLIRSQDEQSLLNEICRIICDEAGYCLAWVGYAEHDDAKSVRPVAWAGKEEGYLTVADISWADTKRGCGPTGTAISTGESSCIQDFSADPLAAPWREQALQRGYRSNIALPLKDGSTKTFGALTIYSVEPNSFTADETHLLEQLAADLAFGITVLHTRTERRQMEQALIVREQEYRTLVENIPDLIVRYDTDLRRIYVNPAWEKASGFTSGKVINMKGVDLLKDINLDTNLKHAALLQNVLKTGTLQKTNLTWINAHGVTLHLSYILVPEYDACGKVTSVLSVGHDITELKRAEEEASRFNKELEQRVKWRTSELEQRNAQLDKMNRLFIGRELRMKELKEKIAQLEDHTNRKIINS